MSVVIATRYQDRVEMATDGGEWDSAGILTACKDKLHAAPNGALAAAGVGGGGAIESLCRHVITSTMGATIDEALAYLARTLPDRPEIASPFRWEMVIGAVSETTGPGIWRMRGLLQDDKALPKLTYCFSPYVALGPELTVDDLRAAGWRAADFSAGLIGQFETMRRKVGVDQPEPVPGFKMAPGHYVGCHIDHAVITKAGVTMNRVHQWPDIVGQPVKP